jgi:hypothetical protein
MSLSRRVLVLSITAALLSAGVAQAHTVRNGTKLGLHRRPQGVVDPGTVVTFRGKLQSQTAACRQGSVVKLIKVGLGVIGSTTTRPSGRYSFRKVVNNSSWYITRFSGKVLNGTHPHNHTCKSDTSNRIRVRVS